MVGRIQCKQERGRSHPREERFSGLPVLTAELFVQAGAGERRLEHRMNRVEQMFRRAGICRVLLPSRFPYRRQLSFLHPVDPMPLYRAAADLLVQETLRRKGIPLCGARVALAAPRLCPELRAAAERLCPTVRELRIDVPGEEGEAFARYLQYEFGVPVVPRQLAVDTVAAFGETGEEADLCLWGEREICLRAAGLDLPEEIEQPLLALLWERGSVKRDALRVINLP